jgi:hypothetical protein
MIPVFERAKAVRGLDYAASVIGRPKHVVLHNKEMKTLKCEYKTLTKLHKDGTEWEHKVSLFTGLQGLL